MLKIYSGMTLSQSQTIVSVYANYLGGLSLILSDKCNFHCCIQFALLQFDLASTQYFLAYILILN